MSNVTEKIHALGEAIQKDPRHIAWKSAKEAQEADIALQEKISRFGSIRDQLMEANMAQSRDDAKITALSDEMRALYEEIMANEVMVTFSEAQENLNELMGEINGLIQFYVTGEEPSSCGGDCAGCSGCSGF